MDYPYLGNISSLGFAILTILTKSRGLGVAGGVGVVGGGGGR